MNSKVILVNHNSRKIAIKIEDNIKMKKIAPKASKNLTNIQITSIDLNKSYSNHHRNINNSNLTGKNFNHFTIRQYSLSISTDRSI